MDLSDISRGEHRQNNGRYSGRCRVGGIEPNEAVVKVINRTTYRWS